MITITACSTAVCLMNQIPISLATVIPFIMTLASPWLPPPGAPGGSIMTALPFLYMVFGAEAGDPQRPHLRHHGGPVYHPGLLRHRLQRVR